MLREFGEALISEEMEELIWENIEKSIPRAEMEILRERYDPGWSLSGNKKQEGASVK